MLKIEVKSDISEKSLKSYAEDMGKKASEQVAQQIFALSQERCPVKTGALKASGSVVEVGAGQHQVVYSCEYAGYVDALPQSMTTGTAHFLSGSMADVARGGVQVE